jgi:hypothetical protein
MADAFHAVATRLKGGAYCETPVLKSGTDVARSEVQRDHARRVFLAVLPRNVGIFLPAAL